MLCNTTSFDAGIPTARHPNDPVCQTGKTPRLTDGRRSALGRGVGARQAEGSRLFRRETNKTCVSSTLWDASLAMAWLVESDIGYLDHRWEILAAEPA